jgi:hypothetical protein
MTRKPRNSGGDGFVCPVCGEEVPAKALACPGCGSDDRTGWSAETEYDGLDLPEPEGAGTPEAWAESGEKRPGQGVPVWVVVTAVLMLALFVVLALSGVF